VRVIRSHVVILSLVLGILGVLAGCSSGTGAGAGGQGGSSGNGGTFGSGGIAGEAGSGGATGLGGVTATGGKGSGGLVATGGNSSAGGASSGRTSTGGSSGAGGGSANGGSGAGGAADARGASSADSGEVTDGGTTMAGAIYVSPDGDDSNPGTLAQPLKTVAKARNLVEALNSAMATDITVYLRGGTYPLTSTLTFANADSGSGGFYVKYMAYPGERPLLTGGQPIKGWTIFDATNNIYSASAGTTAFRQLYVNGVKAIRARTPNLDADGSANFNRLSGWDQNACNVQVPSSAVATWNNLTKVEMHIMTGWGDNTLRIASITTSGGTAYVSFQSPESPMLFIRPNPSLDPGGWGQGRAYYFENAYEFLDQPGEWYLDEMTNTVYYEPRTGEDMKSATVIAPQVETIMAVQGTSTSDQAGYLWFEGLTFAHSTFMRPSQDGFLDAQAGQYNLTADANNDQTVGRPPAGVSVTNANHIHFEGNLFTQMGATGLDFISGTHDDMIIGNAFKDIAGNGLSVGKFTASDSTEFHTAYDPADKNEICTRDTVKDNYIDSVTTEFQGACGIACGYPAYIDIEHNEVSHTNYTGISVGYGWTSATTAMTNNTINYNNIHDVVRLLADGGGIYTLSNQGTGSELEYNYLHDYSQSQWADYCCVHGVYMDEQTSGYTVEHNDMVNCPEDVFRNENGQDTVTDNSSNPSGAQNTMATAGLEPAYATIKSLTIPAAAF